VVAQTISCESVMHLGHATNYISRILTDLERLVGGARTRCRDAVNETFRARVQAVSMQPALLRC
jgi:hypothetical protein